MEDLERIQEQIAQMEAELDQLPARQQIFELSMDIENTVTCLRRNEELHKLLAASRKMLQTAEIKAAEADLAKLRETLSNQQQTASARLSAIDLERQSLQSQIKSLNDESLSLDFGQSRLKQQIENQRNKVWELQSKL